MTKQSRIDILHAALDEDGKKDIILRGVISPPSLRNLRVAPYQREVLPLSSLSELIRAIRSRESLPDIQLGMRGQNFSVSGQDSFALLDPVYIIDGLQRVTAVGEVLKTAPGFPVRLGATIHFDTTEEWERERFRILNVLRAKLSPNVLLRNLKEESEVMAAILGLCEDRGFVLKGRVCWGQRMQRVHLVTALVFMKVIGRLHAHAGPSRSVAYDKLALGITAVAEKIGLPTLLANIRVFFDLIDEAWGLREMKFKANAAYIRSTFLVALAGVLSDHVNFWDGHRLRIGSVLRKKIATFPVHDPNVISLSGSGGQARVLLIQLMLEHINRYKRGNRLRLRQANISDEAPSES